jgi:hypothetical protein
MKAPSIGFKAVCLLLLLSVCVVLSEKGKGMYDDSGFGTFHGHVRANLSDSGTDHFFSMTFEGVSPPTWHWIRPTNYQYALLSIEWSGESSKGTGQVDTSFMILKSGDRRIPISRSSLSELLFDTSTTMLKQEEIDALDEIHQMIAAAGQGQLPPPRHHGYHFETPVWVDMTHFSIGSRYPYSIYWCSGIWIAYCFSIALQRFWTKKHPRKPVKRETQLQPHCAGHLASGLMAS